MRGLDLCAASTIEIRRHQRTVFAEKYSYDNLSMDKSILRRKPAKLTIDASSCDNR